MAVNFPDSPSVNATITVDGKTWKWNGTVWEVTVEPLVTIVDADGDTKMQLEAYADEDKIRFDTAGSERLIIDSTGNVGIGTTSPARTLDIGTGLENPAPALRFTDIDEFLSIGENVGYIEFYSEDLNASANGVGSVIAARGATSTGGHRLDFDTGEQGGTVSTRMTIGNTGKVGIGTTSPAQELHVYTGSANADVRVQGDATGYMDVYHGPTTAGLHASNAVTMRFATNNTNRMYIDSSGNVGINDSTPSYTLDVNGNVAMNGTSQIFANWSSSSDIDGLLPGSDFGGVMYTNTSAHFVIGIRNNDIADSFSVVSGGSNADGWVADNTFDLLVANFRADGNGSIAGTWTTSASDERLKTVMGTITEPLTKISALEGFYFTWNDVASELGLPDADLVQVGVSAQSVIGVMPEAVRTAPISQGKSSETEYYTVMYERLVPLLIEGIKEQQATIDTLTARIEVLEAN